MRGIRDGESSGNERVRERTSWKEVEKKIDVMSTLKEMKDRKASGLEGNAVELLIYGSDSITERLLRICSRCTV